MDNTKSYQSRVLSPMHKGQRQVVLYLEEACRSEGVGPTEMHMLAYVQRYGPCPMKELVRVFGHKPSTLTSMLDRLEAAGQVERQPNPDDRRSYLVASLPAATEVVARCGGILEEIEREILARVSPAELAGFLAVLGAVNDVTRVDVRPVAEKSNQQREEGSDDESHRPVYRRVGTRDDRDDAPAGGDSGG